MPYKAQMTRITNEKVPCVQLIQYLGKLASATFASRGVCPRNIWNELMQHQLDGLTIYWEPREEPEESPGDQRMVKELGGPYDPTYSFQGSLVFLAFFWLSLGLPVNPSYLLVLEPVRISLGCDQTTCTPGDQRRRGRNPRAGMVL